MILLPYAYAPDDISRAIWARLAANPAGTAAVSIGASAPNTDQLPFYVVTVAASLNPGAAQFAMKYQFTIADPDQSSVYAFIGGGELVNTTVAQSQVVSVPVQGVIIPPRFRLEITAIFNAGANANSVQLRALGWYFPRGTLSLP